MRLRIVNETPYPNRVLRSIMLAVGRDVAKRFGNLRTSPTVRILPRDPKPRTFRCVQDGVAVERTVQHARSYTGHAYLNGHKAVLSVPTTGLDVAKFAGLWLHELWHLYGKEHSQMPPDVLWNNRRTALVAPYVARFGETIQAMAEDKPKPSKEEAIVKKLGSLDERERRWKMVAKRADTYLKKIRTQRRYYERRLVQAAEQKPDEETPI